MLRILLLSDIHFIHCEKDENTYRSLETAFVEAMDEVRDSGGLNQILICGDIANCGKEEEYKTAESFLLRVFTRLGCDERRTQVYVVPGNHDIDRSVNTMMRRSLRGAMLDIDTADEFVKQAKHKELDALRTIYSPFEAYYKFANKHSSADPVAVGILSGSNNFNNLSFRKEVDLGMLDNYMIRLHCLNSSWLCDKDDVNDPRDLQPNEHKLFITRPAYNPDTDSTVVNISMMHHPHAWFINESDLRAEFDRKFKLQIYGHVHTQFVTQDVKGKSAIRLQVGSLHPGHEGNPDVYPPLYNILELEVVKNELKVKVKCYSWDGEQFVENKEFSFQGKVALKKKSFRTENQKKEVSKMKTAVENSDDIYSLRYRFFNSEHIKEIICEINSKAYDESKPEYANALAFFKAASLKADVIEELRIALIKYGD